MCGICGFVGYLEERRQVLEKMMSKLIHRGPDAKGIYQDKEVSFGFLRLAIIGAEDGAQPIFNETHSLVLICNGEIYNYRELRQALERKGHIFSSTSDVEVVLHGYEEYGNDILPMLRGMFAFSIWNLEKKELFAARDFFGIKPFYYSMIDHHMVFGSEIKAILPFPGYQKRLNEEALEQYLSFQYSVLQETFFQDIFQLMPGHFLVYREGRLQIEKYFEIKLKPNNSMTDLSDLEKQLRAAIEKSVDRHLKSDVEVGGFLSGGIDSNYLSKMAKSRKLFTVGYDNGYKQYSEVEKAEELKTQMDFEHHIRNISKDDFWRALQSVLYFMDEPCGDASAVSLYFVSGMASRYVKAVLSGEGADELFGGYEIYRESEALKWVNWIPPKIRRMIANIATFFPDIKGRDYLIRAGIPVEERYIGNAHIFTTEERQSLLKNTTGAVATAELLKESYRKTKEMTDIEKKQSIDMQYWLPGDILQKADRMSMAHSLELRVPYLDMEIYEIARTLPVTAKVHDGKTKYLFRKIVSDILPIQIAGRRKLGFPVPIRIWIKEEDWSNHIRDSFNGEIAKKYFRTDILINLLEDHINGKRDNSRKIWTIYMFLLWCDVFDIEN